MASVALARLGEERRNWRRDRPPGFFARPETTATGETNLFRWRCSIPGARGTLWEGALVPLDDGVPDGSTRRSR